MSSNLDVYAPCPCGSGKKVKFCCSNVLVDMDKVARLHEKNQTDKAIEKLESLASKNPNAMIIPLTRAQLLMEAERFDEAVIVMRDFLETNPGHGHATGLLAFARFMDVGFHEAKPEIHRAFQVCPTSSPEMIATLASQIGEEVWYESYMSAREHFALALRLTQDEEERRELFQRLMYIDNSRDIPYPIRGTHQLEEIEGNEETAKDLKTASRLAKLGCWEIAARLYHKVAETDKDNWALWKNIGLCRAWDADESGAAYAFDKAAELADDFDRSVECAVIAQLLDLEEVERFVDIKSTRYDIESTARVLTTLDENDRFHRLEKQEEDHEQLVAQYLMLDKQPVKDSAVDKDQIPNILCEVSIFEREINEDGKVVPFLSVIAADTEGRDSLLAQVESVLGDEISRPTEEDHDHDHDHVVGEFVVQRVLKELHLEKRKFYGPAFSVVERRERSKQDAMEFLDKWTNTPLGRLGDKSPKESSDENESKTQVAAAITVLESINEVASLYIDVANLRSKLNVPEPQPLAVDDSTVMNSLSVMELHRLPLSSLSDQQLGAIVQRAIMLQHAQFLYSVLNEVASRGLELPGLEKLAFLQSFTEVCQNTGRREEAIKWTIEARKIADESDDFESKLNWTMREFQLRIEDPNDEGLKTVVDEVWNYYGKKLPAIRDAVRPVLESFNIDIPSESESILLPGDVEPAASGESKLWLPD